MGSSRVRPLSILGAGQDALLCRTKNTLTKIFSHTYKLTRLANSAKTPSGIMLIFPLDKSL